jgi:iron-sulfur cluster assembly accessory protein
MTNSTIAVTSRAAGRIKSVLGEKVGLRVAVDGGGCSGFQYSFSLADAVESDDVVVEQEGVKVLVDPASLEIIKGSTLDFVDDLMGQSFRMENPNAKSNCGCGTSFSI